MAKDILLLAFGGTISMTPSDAGGVTPGLDGGDLVGGLQGCLQASDYGLDGVTIRSKTLRAAGSANLTYSDIVGLLKDIEHDPADAFIVTQGTDTMEETSFLTRLLYAGNKPIVFTGAMRPAQALGADGSSNLLDALLVAVSDAAPSVCVVMNRAIHDPAFVRKAHTSDLGAFVSGCGPLGLITEGRIRWSGLACDIPVIKPAVDYSWPRVVLVTATFGAHTDDLALAEGADGLVVDTFGVGHVSEIWADKLEDIARHIPVVFASRCGQGPTFERSYGYKGAEIDLISRGLEAAGYLDGRKSRLALSLLTMEDQDNWRKEFRRIRAALE